MLELSPEQAAIVQAILLARLPRPSQVWVFGSRATGKARRFSDLDLAIDAGRRLAASEAESLREAFAESALPWRVDVVDVHNVSPAFRALIFAEAVAFAESPQCAAAP